MPIKTNFGPETMEALEAVLKSRAPASAMRLEYYAGDINLSQYRHPDDQYSAIEAEWGRQDEERPALEFTGVFRGTFDADVLRKRTLTVDLIVETTAGDLRFRRFTGNIRRVTPMVGGTEIQAASGGYWLDKVRFDESKSYVDVEPSEVIWDCVTRAAESGVYNMSGADIEYISGPKVRREEFLLNSAVDKLNRPIAAAVEEGELFFRDSPYNSPLCHRDRGPAEATEVVWEYVVGTDTEPVDFRPETEGDEFDAVLPYRVNDDGSIDFVLEDEDGNPESRVIEIEGSTAPKGASYEINISDESSTAQKDVYHLAAEAAVRLRDGEANTSQTVKWIHPLLVDGDFLSWVEPFEELTRSGTRYWIAKLIVGNETHNFEHQMELIMVRRREELEIEQMVPAYPPARVRGS